MKYVTEQILSRTKEDRETFEDKHLLCSVISKYKYFQARTNSKTKNWNSYKKSRPQELHFYIQSMSITEELLGS